MTPRSIVPALFMALVAAHFQGCGKDSPTAPGNENAAPAGSIRLSPEPCMATFTQDYTLSDVFGGKLFTARAGDSFIVRNSGGFSGTRLYYLLNQGAYDFDVAKNPDGGFPFTSNCTEGSTETYLAVFRNTTVFSDSALTQPLCSLSRESTAPAVGLTGYYLVGGFLSSVYHVELGGFSAQCQGADGGYLKAPETEVFGAITYLIPIDSYLSPAK